MYNCLAYSVGIKSYWIDDTHNKGPINTEEEVTKFMLKQGNYAGRGGDKLTSCKATDFPSVIYYKGGVHGYHFAKVVSYSSDGTPKEIISKWAGWEVVKSSVDFTSDSYGKPTLYFK